MSDVDDERFARFAWATDARWRTLPAAAVCDHFVLAGFAFERETDPEGTLAEARALLDRLVWLGLPFRDGPQGRLFDPVEAQNFVKVAGLSGREPVWREHFVETGRRFVREEAAAAAAVGDDPRRFRVSMRRTFSLQAEDRGRDARLRMPVPLARGGVGDLQVRASGPDGRPMGASAGRVEARGRLPDADTVTLAAEIAFDFDRRATIPHDDPAEALADEVGPLRVTPRVAALAEATTFGLSGTPERVARLWDLLLDRFALVMIPYDRLASPTVPADWVLDHGCFDCRLGGGLLVALCRSIGIPARLAGGWLLYPRAPVPHYWAEIYFDDEGWTSFDLSSWDLSAGGRDEEWRDHFAGRIDARMTTEVLPRIFTGAPGVVVPPVVRIISTPHGRGTATTIHRADTGFPVYRDEVEVTRLDP